MTATQEIIQTIRSILYNLNTLGALKIYTYILKGDYKISVDDIVKDLKKELFIHSNANFLDNDGYLTDDCIQKIIHEIATEKEMIADRFDQTKDIVIDKFDQKTDIIVKPSMNKSVVDSILSKHPDVKFIFNKKLKPKELDVHNMKLQTVLAQVSSGQTDISYPVQFVYRCSKPECKCFEHHRYMYEVISHDYKSNCPNYIINKDGKGKKCNKALKPVIETSVHKNVYFQTVNIFYEGKYHNLNAVSLIPLTPGSYHMSVLVTYDKQPQLFVVGVDEIKKQSIKLPKKESNKHYIKSIRETIDQHIYQTLKIKVSDYDILKEFYIVQRLSQLIFDRSDCNVAVIGEKGIGKTFVAKMYMPCLSDNILFTNIKSISIASLRGTEKKISLLNKMINVATTGQLGSYDTIYIDELLEDKAEDGLLEFLKPFLLESDYGNFKANGDDTLKKKTAQLIISGNIRKIHKIGYRKRVTDYFNQIIAITTNENDDLLFDEKRDLFQNLSSYSDNKNLKKAIRQTREWFYMNEINWIDGTSLPAIDRFQISIYMKGDENYTDDKIVRDIKNALKKNKSYLDICKKLKNNIVENLYKNIKKKIGDAHDIDDILTEKEIEQVMNWMKKIVNKYELNTNSRFTTTFTSICTVLKLVNDEDMLSEETFKVLDKYYSILGKMIKPDELRHDYVQTKDAQIDNESYDMFGGSDLITNGAIDMNDFK